MLDKDYDENYVWNQGGIESYQETFRDLGFSIKRELLLRKLGKVLQKDRSVYALDVLSGLAFLREAIKHGLDKGLAVGTAANSGPCYAEKDYLDLITGNIQILSTWEMLEKWKKEHGIKYFDFVFMRGVGATDETFFIKDSFIFALEHIYQSVDPKGGRIIAQVPRFCLEFLPRWEEEGKRFGIGIQFVDQKPNDITIRQHPIVLLTRYPNSPEKFPLTYKFY